MTRERRTDKSRESKSKALGGRLHLYGSRRAELNGDGAGGGGVWCVQRMSHDHHWLPLAELAISFFSRFLLALTASFTRVNPGSIHLRQLINSKQKSKTNFRVVLPSCRAYILPYTPPVHITRLHIRTTYNNQQAQQTCLYEQWPHRCQPAVSLGSRTKIVLRSSLSRPVCRPRLSAWWLGATIVSAFHDWKFIPHLFLLSNTSKNQRRALTKISQD